MHGGGTRVYLGMCGGQRITQESVFSFHQGAQWVELKLPSLAALPLPTRPSPGSTHFPQENAETYK